MTGPIPSDPRPAGVWAEPYVMPDGSRPITAIDEDGVLRGVFFMRPTDNPVAVHRYMRKMLREVRFSVIK